MLEKIELIEANRVKRISYWEIVYICRSLRRGKFESFSKNLYLDIIFMVLRGDLIISIWHRPIFSHPNRNESGGTFISV